MAAGLTFDGAWRVRVENTFLTIDDDDDNSVAQNHTLRRAASCPPSCRAEQSDVDLLEAVRQRADTPTTPVEVKVKGDQSLSSSIGLGQLTFHGAWRVRVENTFLTIDDDFDDSAAQDHAPRRASLPPYCAKRGDEALLETELHSADSRAIPVEVKAQEHEPLGSSTGPGVVSATPSALQEDARANDFFFRNAPRSSYEKESIEDSRCEKEKDELKDESSRDDREHDQRNRRDKKGRKAPKKKREHVLENGVVLKNIPSRMVEVEVLMAISSMGFYDALEDFNMPMRYDREGRPLNKGFAFVRFADRLACQQFCQAASGHRFKDRESTRALMAELAV